MSAEPERRLLVVTYHFPPGPGVGGLRWAGLTKHLARQGWEVRVVSAFGDGRRSFAPSVEVEARTPRPTAAARYRQWRVARATSGPSDSDGTPKGFRPAPANHVGPIRRLARSIVNPILVWPDAGRGWIRPALRTTRELLRRFRPTAIVSSGPPHSAHLVVRIARGRSGPLWYIDLRDPWSQAPLTLPCDPWLERIALGSADGLIVTNPGLLEILRRQYPRLPTHLVPNGVDLESLPAKRGDPLPGLAVTHLGSLYLGRDPAPVLEAFRRFLEERPEAARAGSALRFVGDGDQPWIGKVAEAAREPSRHVKLSPPLPRDRALLILERSSLALVLAQQQDGMVPAKLYESVALGIPTLVITERGSATFREAKRLGVLCAEPDDLPGITRAFHRVWANEVSPPRPTALAALDHARIAQDVSRILNGHRAYR